MTYKEFIDEILNTRGRFSCGDSYHERHHIVPRVIGPETREKISKANKNPSEETRKKMSEAQKKCQRGENNSRAIKIIDLNTGKIYGCIKQAALELGMNYDRLKYLVRNSIDFIRYDIYENNYNTIE